MKISKKTVLITIISSMVVTSFTACNDDTSVGDSHIALNSDLAIGDSESTSNENVSVEDILSTIDFHKYILSVYNDDENYVNQMYNYYAGVESGNTSDLDGDGVSDEIEFQLELDPKTPDTDGDGIDDLTELLLGLDPLKNDIKLDMDSDGLSNIEEIKYGTNLNNPDTDGDGLSDFDEVFTYKTNPLLVDTDNDGISDSDELKIGLNPLIDTTDGTTKDNQRLFYQPINSEITSSVCTVDYNLSAVVNAGGFADNCISIEVSNGFSSLKNSYTSIVGEVLDINYSSDVAFADMTLTFTLDTSLLVDVPIDADIYQQGVVAYNDWVRQYKDVYVTSTYHGINRYVVFEYDEENSTILPMTCTYNENDNTISVYTTNPNGTYCVVDLYDWLHNYCNMF